MIKMLRVEKLELMPLSERMWAKAGPNRASIDSSEKRIMLDYRPTVLLVKVVRRLRLSLKIPSQYEID